MNDVKNIITVSSEFSADFDSQVNKLIEKGWVISNITIVPLGDTVRYIATLLQLEDRYVKAGE